MALERIPADIKREYFFIIYLLYIYYEFNLNIHVSIMYLLCIYYEFNNKFIIYIHNIFIYIINIYYSYIINIYYSYILFIYIINIYNKYKIKSGGISRMSDPYLI